AVRPRAGRAAGTRRWTGFGASRPLVSSPLTATAGSGRRIFFAAADPAHGGELWVSDGRSGGTRRVTDVGRRQPASDPAELTALSRRLLFTPCGRTSRPVWPSHGPASGAPPPGDPRGAAPCAHHPQPPRPPPPARARLSS